MRCNECGCKDISDYSIRNWVTAYCPICGNDLKKGDNNEQETTIDKRDEQL